MIEKHMERVIVLMSTYNGEKFIREQLDSILYQEGVDVRILARDDGSSDRTLEILDEYKQRGKLDYYTGENLGPARSFMDLVYTAPEAGYYAFCDQDDVWVQGKLKNAIGLLREIKDAALYYHAMNIVDESLVKYDYYFRKEVYARSLEYSCLFGDEIAGCTMVFNRALLEAARKYEPQFITMHDGWLHRVCLSVGGEVTGDDTAYIYYRQHPSNAVGMHKISLSERIKNRKKNERKFSRLAGEMLAGYSECMTQSEKEFLCVIRDYKKRSGVKKMGLPLKDFGFRISYKDRAMLLLKLIMGSL